MSTWMYLTCDSHNPPLLSEDVGQHTYDLPAIVTAIKHRAKVVETWQETQGTWNLNPAAEVEKVIHRAMRDADEFVRPWTVHFPRHAASFLGGHTECQIGIQDEYGRRYDPATGETA